MVYFTSDLHLGHRAIPKYRDRFSTLEEHDRFMLNKIKALGKRDVLFIVGDFLFDGPHYEEYIKEIKTFKCRIKLVLGNHDSKKLYKEYNIDSNIEPQLPLFSYKNMWISHCPIHPGELRNRNGCIHGHLHLENLLSKDYFNVNIDVNDYEFVPLETIKKYLESK